MVGLRDDAPETKQACKHAAANQSCEDAKAKPQGDLRRSQDQALVRRPQDDLQDDRCRDGAYSVDEHALGLEHRRHRPPDAQALEERGHYRRTGYDHQRAKQRGEAPVPTEREMGRDRSADRRDQRPHRDETPDDDLFASEAAQLELEPPFEKNDRDAHTHERV